MNGRQGVGERRESRTAEKRETGEQETGKHTSKAQYIPKLLGL